MKAKLIVPASLKIFSVLVSFLFWALLARVADIEDLGEFSVLFSLSVVLSMAVGYGPGQYVVRSVNEGSMVFKPAFFTWLLTLVVIVLTLSGLSLAVIDLRIAVYVALLVGFSSLSVFMSEVFRAARRFSLAVLGNGFLNVLIASCVFASFIYSQESENLVFDDIVSIYILSTGMMASMMLALYAKMRGRNIVPTHVALPDIKRVLVFSIPVASVPLIVTVLDQVDLWIIELAIESEAVANFNVAQKMARISLLPMIIINVFVGPYIASWLASGDYRSLQYRVNVMSGVAGFCCVIIFLLDCFFGMYFIEVLFGESYRPSFFISLILIVGQFFNVSTFCAVPILVLSGRARLILLGAVFCVVIKVFIYYTMSFYSLLSLTMSALISMVVVALLNIYLVVVIKKFIGINCWPSLVWKDYSLTFREIFNRNK